MKPFGDVVEGPWKGTEIKDHQMAGVMKADIRFVFFFSFQEFGSF